MSEKESAVDISRDSAYTSIFSAKFDHDLLLSLCDFFQYKTANEKDSPLSLKIDSKLADFQKDILYKRMLDATGITDGDFLFNPILRNKIKEIRAMKLSDSTLNCDRIKGFFHQKNQRKDGMTQHKIDSLFKHIRDAFAHGRIGFVDTFVIFEDKVNELTGRLIITIDALLQWKAIIEQYLEELEMEVQK